MMATKLQEIIGNSHRMYGTGRASPLCGRARAPVAWSGDGSVYHMWHTLVAAYPSRACASHDHQPDASTETFSLRNKEVFERIVQNISEHSEITLVFISHIYGPSKRESFVKGKRVFHRRTCPLCSKLAPLIIPTHKRSLGRVLLYLPHWLQM